MKTGSWLNLIHMWKLFKIAELEEGMRQRGDTALIDLLNEELPRSNKRPSIKRGRLFEFGIVKPLN